MSLEALRLRCQSNNLITTGKKAEIAQRLYDHFHPEELEAILEQTPDEVFDEDRDDNADHGA